MNLKLLDSWIRDYLKTDATPEDIAEKLSLTSLSVEKLEKVGTDYLYEFEITTNRPDLFSVLGIAREANAVLPRFGIKSELKKPEFKEETNSFTFPIEVENNPKIVNRICASVLEVKVGESPKEIKERLETSGIRSLNNVIDVTNYVMRTIGHPAHVFDFDRLNTKKIFIREARGEELIQTLDKKTYKLQGGEIVALNDKNEIVDLLGIMGLENSVVRGDTKKILFFIDNNEPYHIRKASMALAIRTEAASLNEKGVDPELAREALNFGIELYKKIADGKVISKTLNIYPGKPKEKHIEVSLDKVDKIIGTPIEIKSLTHSLERLGFKINLSKEKLIVDVPSYRSNDIEIEEDIIEEIARIYGYHNLPSVLPATTEVIPHPFADSFYWEERVKENFKHFGFTEVYSYSFVSEEMFEGNPDFAVKIKNSLTKDFVYMRTSLIPSLLKASLENTRKNREVIKIFEMANVYPKKELNLPKETLMLGGVFKKKNVSFYEVKGFIEALFIDLGIEGFVFKKSENVGVGSSVYIGSEYAGDIEIFDADTIDFEINFEKLIHFATLKKSYRPLKKFPPVVEDISFQINPEIQTEDILKEIKLKSRLISEVSLKDQYKDSRTFHIVYQSEERTLTKEDVQKIRKEITESLEVKFGAKLK